VQSKNIFGSLRTPSYRSEWSVAKHRGEEMTGVTPLVYRTIKMLQVDRRNMSQFRIIRDTRDAYVTEHDYSA
jgi:hypothetical protein